MYQLLYYLYYNLKQRLYLFTLFGIPKPYITRLHNLHYDVNLFSIRSLLYIFWVSMYYVTYKIIFYQKYNSLIIMFNFHKVIVIV